MDKSENGITVKDIDGKEYFFTYEEAKELLNEIVTE